MNKLTLITGIGLIGWSSLSNAQPGERAQEAFNSIDINGDGNISFEEFQENDRNPVERLDTDADGMFPWMSFWPAGRRDHEKVAAASGVTRKRPQPTEEQIAEMQAMMQERAAAKFAEMDLDGDGQLSALEMAESTFLDLDSDSNGVLTVGRTETPRSRWPRSTWRPSRQ